MIKSGSVYLFLIFFLLFSSIVKGQTEIRILDSDGKALAGAHISFSSVEDHKSHTVVSDLNGVAVLPEEFISKNPTYLLSIAYVGFITVHDTIKEAGNLDFRMQPDEIALNQFVVTGQYAPNSVEKSVHRIKIISREQMDSRGVVNLNDALQFETNIRIAQDNMLGSAASVQGLSGENVKIMIDGVPVIGRQDGSIDLNQINLNNVERIEIVEGPLSVNYGTNALAGTINLITKKDQKEKYNASVNSYYESVGQYNLDGGFNFQKGQHRIGVTGGRNFFDGWSPDESYSLFPKSKPADTNRNLQWNPKEQYFGNVQYTYSVNKNTYRVYANFFNEDILSRGDPGPPYYLYAFDEHFNTQRLITGLDANGVFSTNSNWSVIASYSDYNRYRNTYYNDLTTLNKELTNNPDQHDTTQIKTWMSRGTVHLLPESSIFRWEFGYDVNHESATGKRIENKFQTMGDYALFATTECNMENGLTIKPGLRYAYNTSYSAPLVPSINFKYSKRNSSVRLSYARGFRAPSLKELYFEFVDINHNIYGNQDLKAESSHNVQLGYSHRMIKGQELSTIELGGFYNDISDMISLAQIENTQSYTYINIGKYRTMGIDLSGNKSINHWKIGLGFVYTGRSDFINDTTSTNGLFFSPEARASLLYEFKSIGGNLALYYKYNGKIPVYSIDETGGSSGRFSEAYQMLDIAATKYLIKSTLHITIGFKNLLDVTSISTAGTAGSIHNNVGNTVPISWGRSVFVSLKYNVSWK